MASRCSGLPMQELPITILKPKNLFHRVLNVTTLNRKNSSLATVARYIPCFEPYRLWMACVSTNSILRRVFVESLVRSIVRPYYQRIVFDNTSNHRSVVIVNMIHSIKSCYVITYNYHYAGQSTALIDIWLFAVLWELRKINLSRFFELQTLLVHRYTDS